MRCTNVPPVAISAMVAATGTMVRAPGQGELLLTRKNAARMPAAPKPASRLPANGAA